MVRMYVLIGWYTNEIANISRTLGVPVIAPWNDMPDNQKCKEKIWIPFIINELLNGHPTQQVRTHLHLTCHTSALLIHLIFVLVCWCRR
jgi:hypothetical protein